MLKDILDKIRGKQTPNRGPTAVECILSHHASRAGVTALVGAVGSGKSLLQAAVVTQAQGPVIVVSAANGELHGADDAPFIGTFAPADDAPVYCMDMEEMVRLRPAGVFRLEVPRGWHGTSQGALFERMLIELLLTTPNDGGRQALVVLEEVEQLVAQHTLPSLVSIARVPQLAIVLTAQSLAHIEPALPDVSQVVVLRQAGVAAAGKLAELLAVSAETLVALPLGHAYVRSELHGEVGHGEAGFVPLLGDDYCVLAT